MQNLLTSLHMSMVLSLATVGLLANDSDAQAPQIAQLPLRPSPPSGLFGQLGIYKTIEGVLYDGNGKVPSNTLVVDRVDGKFLNKPVHIHIKNVRLPGKVRCVFKGYELGQMIGRPPAEYAAHQELGGDPNELAQFDAIGWQWQSYFVPLLAIQPKGLEVTTRWGSPVR